MTGLQPHSTPNCPSAVLQRLMSKCNLSSATLLLLRASRASINSCFSQREPMPSFAGNLIGRPQGGTRRQRTRVSSHAAEPEGSKQVKFVETADESAPQRSSAATAALLFLWAVFPPYNPQPQIAHQLSAPCSVTWKHGTRFIASEVQTTNLISIFCENLECISQIHPLHFAIQFTARPQRLGHSTLLKTSTFKTGALCF